MDIISDKLDILDVFYKELEHYFMKLTPLLENTHKNELRKIKALLLKYSDTKNELIKVLNKQGTSSLNQAKKDQKKAQITSDETMFYIANMLNTLDNCLFEIKTIYDMFNVHSVEYSTHMSKSYILETELVLRGIEKKNILFTKNNTSLNIKIIKILTDKILHNISELTIDNDILQMLDIIQQSFEKYPLSIHLYSNILQMMLINTSSNIYGKILSMIEKSKTFILNMPKCFENGLPDFSVNPPIRTFGLFPICESKELCIILKDVLNIDVKCPGNIDLKLIGNLGICIIVLKKIIKNPIEFKIWQLIDPLLAEQYKQPVDMGITQKLIDKCNTISMTVNKSSKKAIKKILWDFDTTVYGNISGNKFLILDTIDGEKYRVLSIWKTPLDKAVLPKYRLEVFLNFYFKSTYTRADQYHNIMTQAALKNMFLDSLGINKIDNANIYESKYLRHAIFNEIKSEFTTLIDSSSNKSNLTQIQFSDIVHNDVIYNMFYTVIMNYYNEYIGINKGLLEKVHFPYSEILVTFLSFLKNLTIEFKKEMHAQYVRLEPSKTIFEGSEKSSIKYKLSTVFDDILANTLNTIITDESNIYQSALKKYQLLSLI